MTVNLKIKETPSRACVTKIREWLGSMREPRLWIDATNITTIMYITSTYYYHYQYYIMCHSIVTMRLVFNL